MASLSGERPHVNPGDEIEKSFSSLLYWDWKGKLGDAVRMGGLKKGYLKALERRGIPYGKWPGFEYEIPKNFTIKDYQDLAEEMLYVPKNWNRQGIPERLYFGFIALGLTPNKFFTAGQEYKAGGLCIQTPLSNGPVLIAWDQQFTIICVAKLKPRPA